ncbi:MAG: hypothetical protein QXT63_07040, partial [Thermoplasmata archaeon]
MNESEYVSQLFLVHLRNAFGLGDEVYTHSTVILTKSEVVTCPEGVLYIFKEVIVSAFTGASVRI